MKLANKISLMLMQPRLPSLILPRLPSLILPRQSFLESFPASQTLLSSDHVDGLLCLFSTICWSVRCAVVPLRASRADQQLMQEGRETDVGGKVRATETEKVKNVEAEGNDVEAWGIRGQRGSLGNNIVTLF